MDILAQGKPKIGHYFFPIPPNSFFFFTIFLNFFSDIQKETEE